MSSFEVFSTILGVVNLVVILIGGFFALYQWKKGNRIRSNDMARPLIDIIRNDITVAKTMIWIDWDKNFYYDGHFHIIDTTENYNEDDAGKMVNYTLSIFNYICYLKSCNYLSNKDMLLFEYQIHAISINVHIRNYLYSIYHYCERHNTVTSFIFLIKSNTFKKNNFPDFLSSDTEKYIDYLKNVD